jgi:dihydroorotate dehydrogenase (fumarate)
MANLNTTYAGLKLRNPFIISSSGITSSVERIRKLDTLGAGAIVLKSLFEEQIRFESGELMKSSDYPEAADYIERYNKENSIGEYLQLIVEAKKAVTIPVIASINCVSASEWMSFAGRIEEAGADALEVNVYILPTDKDKSSADFEKVYFDLVAGLKEKISIPLIIKLGSNFTNLTSMVNQLYFRKADAVVLFNRFYAPDIDLEEMKMGSAEVLSSSVEIRNTLRWIGIISGTIPEMNLAGSTGIHSGEAVIKMLLAGATAVQICSALYKNGLEYLTEMIDKLESWMLDHNYKSIDEFRGMMNYANLKDPASYERSQFMKYFSSFH